MVNITITDIELDLENSRINLKINGKYCQLSEDEGCHYRKWELDEEIECIASKTKKCRKRMIGIYYNNQENFLLIGMEFKNLHWSDLKSKKKVLEMFQMKSVIDDIITNIT